jgi:MerR family transcriptional regulator/heat shock protein HspR
VDDNLPVYIISSAAGLLGIHPLTLHLYEEKGLIVSARKGNRRFYSAGDLQWINTVRYLVHERGINLEGLRQLLALRAQVEYRRAFEEPLPECKDLVGPTAPCWEEGVARFECRECPVYNVARDGLRVDQNVPDLSLGVK